MTKKSQATELDDKALEATSGGGKYNRHRKGSEVNLGKVRDVKLGRRWGNSRSGQHQADLERIEPISPRTVPQVFARHRPAKDELYSQTLAKEIEMTENIQAIVLDDAALEAVHGGKGGKGGIDEAAIVEPQHPEKIDTDNPDKVKKLSKQNSRRGAGAVLAQNGTGKKGRRRFFRRS